MMKQKLFSLCTLGLLTLVGNSALANDPFNSQVQADPFQNTAQTDPFQQDQSVNSFDPNFQAQQNTGNVEKTVKVKVTNKTINNFKQVPHSLYEYVNQLAKANGYETFWLLKDQKSLSIQTPLTDKFYQDETISWQSKVAKAIEDLQPYAISAETTFNGYLCDNGKLLVSYPSNVSTLYKTNNFKNCNIMISSDEVKTYINGVEYNSEKSIEEQMDEIQKLEENKDKEKQEDNSSIVK